ncbi:MAG TPA: hypothetical protein VLW47_10255 [Thermodesulfobacteriota bacterium]|nr:hypothetical protein [Thermodesulfobacteriota bacterium]
MKLPGPVSRPPAYWQQAIPSGLAGQSGDPAYPDRLEVALSSQVLTASTT